MVTNAYVQLICNAENEKLCTIIISPVGRDVILQHSLLKSTLCVCVCNLSWNINTKKSNVHILYIRQQALLFNFGWSFKFFIKPFPKILMIVSLIILLRTNVTESIEINEKTDASGWNLTVSNCNIISILISVYFNLLDKNRIQLALIISRIFKGINQLLFLLESSEKPMIFW